MESMVSAGLSGPEAAVSDLGPLAWVLDELRKSLEGASKALRKFVRDAEAARGSDLASVDASQLRIARQQLHQAVGAMEMVGLAAPAHLLRGMEQAAQQFVQHPAKCSEAAAAVIERAGFALIEYLEILMGGAPDSSVGLFPQYRDVQKLINAERIHPADLWTMDWRWVAPVGLPPASSTLPDRARVDQAVLLVMQKGDPHAADELRACCLTLGAAAGSGRATIFWAIGAAFFEAIATGLLRVDLYVKRVASRVLLQYTQAGQGDAGLPERLARDLLFFCSQAMPRSRAEQPCLAAVRAAYRLEHSVGVDYEVPRYGRYDPSLLVQARKRIEALKESWTAVSGGDLVRLKGLNDQFGLVADSMVRLHPEGDALAKGLRHAADITVRSGKPPSAELALEVATAILYLEAALAERRVDDHDIRERTTALAHRLEAVCAGGEAQPLEPWMEDLYRRVSDRQTMGTVVGELRVTLGEAEKALDQFFRNPTDRLVLGPVPGHLAQMRGVLSVLGLDQAVQAVGRMRETVEGILAPDADTEALRASGGFERLGNNLGALGFLIDMLNYQPALARKLFVYDDESGELQPLMGRSLAPSAPELPEATASEAAPSVDLPVEAFASTEVLDFTPASESVGESEAVDGPGTDLDFDLGDMVDIAAAPGPGILSAPAPAPVTPPPMTASAGAASPEVDEELREIFLEEAREVIHNGLASIEVLRHRPSDLEEQTSLRRAFHTLKGSSRMVQLKDFGEGAWSMEQVLNAWLSEHKPATEALCALSRQALQGFAAWIEDIAAGRESVWTSAAFQPAADAFRLHGDVLAIEAPPAVPVGAWPGAAATGPVPMVAEVVDLSINEAAAALGVGPDTLAPVVAEMGAEPPPMSEPAEALAFSASAPEPGEHLASGGDGDVLQAENGVEVIELADDLVPSGASLPAAVAAALEPDWTFSLEEPAVGPLHAIEPETAEVLPPAAGGESSPDGLQVEEVFTAEAPDLIEAFFEEAAPAPSETPVAAPAADVFEPVGLLDDDEPVKRIGPLRIGLPLFNVYLNEADDWSRRLETGLSEWLHELHHPVPPDVEALAHSLAGSSATVGFISLSELARALEHAIQRIHGQSGGTPAQASVLRSAAEEIRRLLHQFAAGFLKEPDPRLLQALHDVEAVDWPSASAAPEAGAVTFIDDASTTGEPSVFSSEERHSVEGPPSLADRWPAEDWPPEPPAGLPFADLDRSIERPEAVSTPPVSPDSGPHDGMAVAAQEGWAAAGAFEPPADEPVDVAPDLAAESVAPQLSPVPAAEVAESGHSPESGVGASAPAFLPSAPVPGPDGQRGAMLPDLDLDDTLDPDLFPVFEEEALELLPVLSGALRRWVDHPEQLDARAQVLRTLHTLKGSARLAGAMRLGELAHQLESEIQGLGTEALSDLDIRPLLLRLDTLEALFEALRHQGQQVDLPATLPSPVPAVMAPAPSAVPAGPVSPVLPVPARGDIALPAPIVVSSTRAAGGQAVRVRAQVLDRLVNQAGEIMISRSRIEAELLQLRTAMQDLTGNLDRLRQQLRDIELQAETQMQSRMAQAKDAQTNFDPLEFDRYTRVQELTRMMAESVNDVATVQRNIQRAVEATEDDLLAQTRQTRELQRDLLRTRMVEFEGISERLYRVVRQASKDTGKQVKLDILGGSIEMDRGILDRMTPAFEHLLRNCVVHGIEPADRRQSAGKDAAGSIVIELQQTGTDVSVEFRDDGAGLDLARIRQRALQQGLIQPELPLSDADAAQLVFMPGFTTAGEVTELAGRGIGMDVVRTEVQALGGRIETRTESGRGAAFKLVLPLTTAVTQVVMMRVGSLSIGVPANLVEIVRRVGQTDMAQAYAGGQMAVGAEHLPFFWAGALLQASAASGETPGRTSPVVILRSASQRVAVHVDEVLGNQEVVVKNLGAQLSRLPGLAGMTVLASGAVVLIYNPVALAAVYGDQAHQLTARAAAAAAADREVAARVEVSLTPPVQQVPLVLVVDDSITVRRVTQRLLQREGYRVALAADGLQALERLQDERPAIVLSDIEMPRMDGFDLVRNLRADPRLRDLPVVMITSRIAEKHREHARELGVNHYLGKPYAEEELLALVHRYAATGVAA